MPLTKKGKKILRAMRAQYGPEKAKEVFYASINVGKLKGTHKSDAELAADDRRRKTVQRDPFGREKATFEEEEDAARCPPDDDDDDDDDLDEAVDDARGASAEHKALMEELQRPRDGAAWKDPENAEHVTAYETLARAAHEVHRFSRARANSMLVELTHARKRIGSDGTSDYRDPFSDAQYDREFSAEQRKEAASKGQAMQGGGYPIKNKSDLKNAIQAIGRAKNREATMKHIKKRAAALGASEMLPSSWGDASPVMTILGDVVQNVPMVVRDAFIIDDDAKLHYTEDGYLVANPRIARTGIQVYGGDEVGMPSMDEVRVFRPETEVFAPDAVATYAHLPMTDDHPGQLLTPKNWAKYVKGETGDEILRDGKAVRIPMMLRDHDTIQAFKDGKNQLSVGYTCDIDWTPGRTDSGEVYDCVQRNIRANHLAVVTAARGGPTLKIGDDAGTKGEPSMSAIMKTVVIDNITCEMSDTAAQVVNNALARMAAQMDAFKKKADEDDEECEDARSKLDQANTSIKAKDAQIATLQQQLKDAEMTPAKLDGLVKDRASVIDKARKVMGSSLVIDGRTVEDIRRQVVEARLGARANGWDNNQVQASFDTLTEGRASSPVQDAVAAFGRPGFVDADPRMAAYDEYDRDMANAWRGPQAKTAAA